MTRCLLCGRPFFDAPAESLTLLCPGCAVKRADAARESWITTRNVLVGLGVLTALVVSVLALRGCL